MHTYRITIKLRVKPTIKTKRVAILGAGPGGIVSAKYAIENGFTPVVFDKKSIPGGLWSSGTAIWEGMHTNVSRYSVMFSDFPWPDKASVIPSAKEVYNYLLSYIKHFQLENYFQFNSNVDQCKYLPNKKVLF
jgi:dimethylaniline monooxygenase (N-oxide forming)